MPEHRQIGPLTRAVLLAFGLVVLGLLFRQLVTLVVAVLITVLLAIPLAAVTDRLERYRVPRWIGALVGLLIGVGTMTAVVALIIPPFGEQLEEFVDAVPGIVHDLEIEAAQITGSDPSDVGEEVQDFLQRFVDNPEELVGPLATLGLSLAGIVGALILMMITAYYIAVNPAPLLGGMTSLFPPARREWARGVMRRLRDSWVGWMQGVLVDMLVTGVLLYLGLTLIGLDFAIFFAVLSAFLVLIPYFGAIIGAIPPTLFALTDSPEKALLALIVYVVVQQVESNLTIPLVMANRVRLHPALVAAGVIVIGQLFGFLGLFVAVPILSFVMIAVDEIWVKPMEAERGVQAAGGADLAIPGEPEPARERDPLA